MNVCDKQTVFSKHCYKPTDTCFTSCPISSTAVNQISCKINFYFICLEPAEITFHIVSTVFDGSKYTVKTPPLCDSGKSNTVIT